MIIVKNEWELWVKYGIYNPATGRYDIGDGQRFQYSHTEKNENNLRVGRMWLERDLSLGYILGYQIRKVKKFSEVLSEYNEVSGDFTQDELDNLRHGYEDDDEDEEDIEADDFQ